MNVCSSPARNGKQLTERAWGHCFNRAVRGGQRMGDTMTLRWCLFLRHFSSVLTEEGTQIVGLMPGWGVAGLVGG